jgi:3',5'-cyclic AMP phosphodiesterase CpdA
MKIIAHISDLHFGREDKKVVEALLADLVNFSLSLVVVSGDLTQRARPSEFIAAKTFLNRLPIGYLVVPGNHDIPLYNLLHRLTRPLERYCQYITDDLAPTYQDNEIAILGANTARSLTWKNGSLSNKQIFDLSQKLQEIPGSVFKVVVTHHQFLPQPGKRSQTVIKRAPLALQTLETMGVDLILAGHLHVGYQDDARIHHPISKSILVAQAGTAVSTRYRGEPNTYNLILVEQDCVSIMIRGWNGKEFMEITTTTYLRSNLFWQRK